MASTLLPKRRRVEVSSEPPVMVGGLMSINDLPNEMLLKILSHIGPEDVCFIISEVCEKWNALSKAVPLWKTVSYHCNRAADISRVEQVRCAALLGFRVN
jgi:hypothetical protein